MKKSPIVIEPRFRITCGRRFAFGPGQAALLDQIKKTGSIAEAAKKMAMSYMRAWTLVKNMNGGFVKPLIETIRGGRHRGGAKLTATGRQVLQLYQQLETKSLRAVHPDGQKLARLLRS